VPPRMLHTPGCPPTPHSAGCALPTIAVLYEDTRKVKHLRAYEVSVKDKVGGWGRVG